MKTEKRCFHVDWVYRLFRPTTFGKEIVMESIENILLNPIHSPEVYAKKIEAILNCETV